MAEASSAGNAAVPEPEGPMKIKEESGEEDPIVASFDMFIKPNLKDGSQIIVLQFPNRDPKQAYTAMNDAAPVELRTKPKSGMVELDVPIDTRHNYDKDKGVKWGSAMKKSEAKGPGVHGIAAGFGLSGGARIVGARGPKAKADEEEFGPGIRNEDFERARQSGNVLSTQTLGGQIPQTESHSPQYMLGTFVDNQLHLTPVDSIVQLRPQFHHLDAQAELDRLMKAPTGPVTRVQEARAIQMMIKNPVDGEDDNTVSMVERLASTQAENWRRHNWVDENTDEAWVTYRENLLVARGELDAQELKSEMPQLDSLETPADYLDNISAPRDAAKLSRSKVFMKSRSHKKSKSRGKGKGKDVVADGESESDDSEEETDPAVTVAKL